MTQLTQDNTDIQATLTERGKRYGEFEDHAAITQLFKRFTQRFLEEQNKPPLSNSQQESLDMIFHKIGRILNGDPNYVDSWVDIAGYAQLIVNELTLTQQRKEHTQLADDELPF
jgi:hypothetical protein